jgi:hypothetical protein
MNLYAQIRELLTQYASEQIDLQTFREKFVLLYRDGIRSDQETADLGKTVEVLYGDLLCNEFDEKTFIKKLLAIPAGLSKTKAPYAAIIELQFFQFTPLSGSVSLNSTGSTQRITTPDAINELHPS